MASIKFTRPLKTTSALSIEQDLEEGKTYLVHLSWGVFNNPTDEDKSKLYPTLAAKEEP